MNLMKTDKRIFVSAIFLCMLQVLLFSCKKEANEVGISVQPDDDLLNASIIDTFTIDTHCELEDSLITDDLTYSLLGSYVDPVFGKSTSEIYTQLGLSTVGSTIDLMSVTIDSVRLYIRYGNYYGTLDPQTLSVKRITEKFYKDSVYRSNNTLTTDGVELIETGYETITPDYQSNVVVGTDTLSPMMVVRLNTTFGMDVLNLYSTGGLASESAFNDQFYGLNISVNNPSQTSGQGAILAMNMTDAQTKMVIYYTESSVAKQLAFPVSTNQSRFSHFTHDYTGTVIDNQLTDSLQGNKFYYIQAMAGLKSVIRINGLSNLNSLGNIIINKAELFLPVQYFTTNLYSPSNNAYVFYKNSENNISVTIDQISSTSTYGGAYDNTKKAFVFNIGRHVQRVVKGDIPNLGFVLNAASASVSANRVILSGRNSPNKEKPYLKIYYTKY